MLILIIVFVALFVIYVGLILLYLIGWLLPSATIAHLDKEAEPILVSIIIPARNEAENIAACIQSILNNRLVPVDFEILLIDDFSEDATGAIAAQLLSASGKGRVLSLANYLSPAERINSYKKKALEIAIAEAKGSWIVTTDADCVLPDLWLHELCGAMRLPNVKFVAAPVSFTPVNTNRTWLYYFQSLDFMTMQGITAACARLNLGNMCNGANLAFEKAAFYAVGAYSGIDQIASGDDMLLMYKIRSKYPKGIQYLKSANAIVATPVQPNWSSFINQRIRWSSKADKYDDKKLTLMLAMVYLFNLSLPIVFLGCLFSGSYWWCFLSVFFAKIVVELLFLLPVAQFYKKKNELWIFPFLQPLHIVYIITAGFLGKFGTYKWKGRVVH